MNLSKYTIAICLVPHGYEIDLLNHKEYLKGIVKIEHSECRDYGEDINVQQVSKLLLDFIRNAETIIK